MYSGPAFLVQVPPILPVEVQNKNTREEDVRGTVQYCTSLEYAGIRVKYDKIQQWFFYFLVSTTVISSDKTLPLHH